MLKLEKNLSEGFKVIDIFVKNAVFNINACRYLKGFYTYKKINNSFLKFKVLKVKFKKLAELSCQQK